MQWRRIFSSRGFYFAVLIQCFAYLYPHMDAGTFWDAPLSYFGSADLLYFFLMPRTNGLCIFLLPFVAVLPAATLLAEDVHSGYIRFLLQRVGKTKYLGMRMLQAAAGGAAASLAGSLLYLAFIMVVCPWNDHILVSWRKALALGSYAALAQTAYGLPVIAEGVSRFCLEAMTWSLVGFAFVCFFKNAGVALALTFMCHYSIIYLCESYASLAAFSPSFIAVPDIATSTPLSTYYWIQFLYLGLALGFSLAAAYWVSRRLVVNAY